MLEISSGSSPITVRARTPVEPQFNNVKALSRYKLGQGFYIYENFMANKIDISSLIKEAGAHLRAEFEFIKSTNPHYGERGAEAENILIEFLNKHLPKRFAAASGFVIDRANNISSQMDVLIYDALNSPVYRKQERVSILPSDNVATAIEVKSKLNKAELQDASIKISSVKKKKKRGCCRCLLHFAPQ